ncbi:class I SAM-dependent methyltransferase [Burkholderiales bacterium]|jgi:SAM-dependent methyltransferase|nr:class I SAM-dependent methyltransferase [Burkholderiales bacterium]
MDRLTEKEYWESFYKSHGDDCVPNESGFIKRFLKNLFGSNLIELFSAYDNYLLWHEVFPRYLLDSDSPLSVLEIGSAPGHFMAQFAKSFSADCFGVEYTQKGAEVNRKVFSDSGLNPSNVIEADFFSDDFIDANKNRFDVVISRGFIEHFKDVQSAVSRHTKLLKPGGTLFILIPNLRGIYGLWTRSFNPEQLPLHNLEIMKLRSFKALFAPLPLRKLRCSYFGTLSFWMFTAPTDRPNLGRVIGGLLVVQRVLNLFLRLVFRKKGFETAIFSPNLIYVGRKEIDH